VHAKPDVKGDFIRVISNENSTDYLHEFYRILCSIPSLLTDFNDRVGGMALYLEGTLAQISAGL
jgi:hypothetical protein